MHADRDVGKVGVVPELLAGMHVGQVHLDERHLDASSASRSATLVWVKPAGLMIDEVDAGGRGLLDPFDQLRVPRCSAAPSAVAELGGRRARALADQLASVLRRRCPAPGVPSRFRFGPFREQDLRHRQGHADVGGRSLPPSVAKWRQLCAPNLRRSRRLRLSSAFVGRSGGRAASAASIAVRACSGSERPAFTSRTAARMMAASAAVNSPMCSAITRPVVSVKIVNGRPTASTPNAAAASSASCSPISIG